MISIKVLSTKDFNGQKKSVQDFDNPLPEDKSQWCNYFNLAMQCGHLSDVAAYLKALNEEKLRTDQWTTLIQANTSDGYPALYIAMQYGHVSSAQRRS